MVSSTDATERFSVGQLVMIRIGPLAGKSGYVQMHFDDKVKVAVGGSRDNEMWVLTEYVEAVNVVAK